jgi:hypothetical protein
MYMVHVEIGGFFTAYKQTYRASRLLPGTSSPAKIHEISNNGGRRHHHARKTAHPMTDDWTTPDGDSTPEATWGSWGEEYDEEKVGWGVLKRDASTQYSPLRQGSPLRQRRRVSAD